MGWKTFNDRLAILIIVGLPILWAFVGLGKLVMPGEIIGATIAGWTLTLQFYFRKAPENGTPT